MVFIGIGAASHGGEIVSLSPILRPQKYDAVWNPESGDSLNTNENRERRHRPFGELFLGRFRLDARLGSN